MNRYTRIFEVQRNSVDVDAGTFEADVFTGGEATDGHILSMDGGSSAKAIPLFVNHEADPRTQLGSLHFVGRNDDAFRYRGEIAQDLEGEEGAVARNLLRKMADGHVRRMSGRWDYDDGTPIRRVNLSKDHPAYVSDKANGPKRFGLFFPKWRAMEGSIVGLGADPAATMRALADGEDPPIPDSIISEGDSVGSAYDPIIELAEPTPEPTALERFSKAYDDLLTEGLTPEQIHQALGEVARQNDDVAAVDAAAEAADAEESEIDAVRDLLEEMNDRLRALEERSDQPVSRAEGQAAVAPAEPVEAEPSAPIDITPAVLGAEIRNLMHANQERLREMCVREIRKAMGVIQR